MAVLPCCTKNVFVCADAPETLAEAEMVVESYKVCPLSDSSENDRLDLL